MVSLYVWEKYLIKMFFQWFFIFWKTMVLDIQGFCLTASICFNLKDKAGDILYFSYHQQILRKYQNQCSSLDTSWFPYYVVLSPKPVGSYRCTSAHKYIQLNKDYIYIHTNVLEPSYTKLTKKGFLSFALSSYSLNFHVRICKLHQTI